ncbi:MAG: hypothetical protein QOJ60_1662 [Actinomycetota bacterium]|jgi:hypothetical protein|nr:hypothetical protein [Actinomycetota bacterium]
MTEPTGPLAAEIEILQNAVDRLTEEVRGLRLAMASRSQIDQAKGALRATIGVSGDEAFALMAARSQNTNRKLVEVARDVLADLDGGSDRPWGAVSGGTTVAPSPVERPTRWRSRCRWTPAQVSVTDPDQLRSLIELGSRLDEPADLDGVREVLVSSGAEAVGAYAASVLTRRGDGRLDVRPIGAVETGGSTEPLAPYDDGRSPEQDVLATGSVVVLGRPELERGFRSLAVVRDAQTVAFLPLGVKGAPRAVWRLCFDLPLHEDRSMHAFLGWAARIASGAFVRTFGPTDLPATE